MTAVVSDTDFCRDFPLYQRRVQLEPIEVRTHQKVTGYFVSAEDFARVEQFLAAARRGYHPSELPPHLQAAVRNSKMGTEHDHLNELMDGE